MRFRAFHASSCRRALPALLVFFTLAGAALGYSSRSNPLEALAAGADLVVHGEVVEVVSGWNAERTRITTRVRLRVEETVRAAGSPKAGEEVTIEVPGGRVGDRTLVVSGEAIFREGEEVVVFLKSGTGAYRVLDGDNGKLLVRRPAKGPALVETWRGEAPLLMGGSLERDAGGRALLASLVEEVRFLEGLHPPRTSGKAAGGVPPDQPGDIPPSATPSFHLTFANQGVSICPNQPSFFVHWALGDEEDCDIEVEVNPNIPAMASGAPTVQPIPPPADVAAAVGEAIQAWNDVSPAVINLVVAGGGEPCPQTPTVDGINCIFWDPDYPADSTKPASTHSTVNGNGTVVEIDIQLNPRPHDMDDDTCDLTPLGWTTDPDCDQKFPLSVKVVVMHELGHLLGLAHPNETSPSNKSVCTRWDSGNQTLMHATYNDSCEGLHQADKDGLNFLYSADLGDAEDDPYPTLIHGDGNEGPEHLFGIHTQADDPALPAPRYQYEWLGIGDGGIIDDNPMECEALVPDNDLDDGVEIHGECKDGTLEPEVTVRIGVKTAADIVGQTHDYTASRMFLNGWFDWNDDGTFADGEHVIGAQALSFAVDAPGVFTFDLTAPDDTPCDVQSRFRLDWIEDVGQSAQIHPNLAGPEGAAIFGEVEDYVGLTHDEGGDPPPPPPPPRYCHEGEVQVTATLSVYVKLDEPCHEPQGDPPVITTSETEFPLGASECFETTATTGIDLDADGVVDEEIGLTGPACVTRSNPYLAADGLMTIDTEMTLFELSGYSPGLGPITLQAINGEPILGQIKQSLEALAAGVHLSAEYPADSTFTMFFEVTGDFGVSDPVGPLEVAASLATVPPVEPSDTIEPPPVRPTQIRPIEPGLVKPIGPGQVKPIGLVISTTIDP